MCGGGVSGHAILRALGLISTVEPMELFNYVFNYKRNRHLYSLLKSKLSEENPVLWTFVDYIQHHERGHRFKIYFSTSVAGFFHMIAIYEAIPMTPKVFRY